MADLVALIGPHIKRGTLHQADKAIQIATMVPSVDRELQMAQYRGVVQSGSDHAGKATDVSPLGAQVIGKQNERLGVLLPHHEVVARRKTLCFGNDSRRRTGLPQELDGVAALDKGLTIAGPVARRLNQFFSFGFLPSPHEFIQKEAYSAAETWGMLSR